jgi:hypothetical protein
MAFKNKRPPIDYTARDFATIKEGLIDHAKRYYPETFKDFDQAGFGSLMLDTVAYIGDVLSFYTDYQTNETFLETALEQESILKIGKQMGYRYKASGVSTGLVEVYIEIPANSDGTPNTNYLPIMKRGSTFNSIDGGTFTLTDDINFNDDNVDILLSKVNESTGVPTFYVLRKAGEVVSGTEQTEVVLVEEFEAFRKEKIADDVDGEIIEILSVFDTEGNEYFEVDSLSQDIVYKAFANKDSNTNSLVPNILKPLIVPRRFTVEANSIGEVYLQFGGGSDSDVLNDEISDPSSVALQQRGKSYISSTYFDPNVLAYNDKLGIGPSNTTLEITYLVNNEEVANASVNAVNQVASAILEFNDEETLDATIVADIRAGVEVDNEVAIVGDIEAPTIEELRQRVIGAYSIQNRAVTREDYIYLSYAMPSSLGAVKRANAARDPDSQKRNLNLYVLSEDTSGNFSSASSVLKNNLRTWLSRYKMINDTVDIFDAKIVNLGINFSVLAEEDANKYDVLQLCVDKLTTDLTQRKFDIGENFNIIEIYKSLKELEEVVDVLDVEIVSKFGSPYTDLFLSIDEALTSDGRVVVCPDNAVFEIKFPESDIKGTVK